MVLLRSCRACGLQAARNRGTVESRRASSSARRSSDPSGDLRELMRHVAQPVAIVTAPLQQSSSSKSPAFHGATLSSFTSIALHPQPLVAFSLRLPSRMAEALRISYNEQKQSQGQKSRIAVALLSTPLHSMARAFSKPLESHSHLYSDSRIWNMTSQEGLPVAQEALGNLICEVTHSIRLSELERDDTEADTEAGSEMFICKVVRVETAIENSEEPLLYLRHRFVRPGEDIKEDEEGR